MSDHPTHDEVPDDVPVEPAPTPDGTDRRRRTLLIALAAVLAVLVAVAVGVALALTGGDDDVTTSPTTPPPSSVTASPTDSPTDAPTVTETTTSAAVTSAAPTTSTAPPAAPTPGPTTIPSDLRLPHEGEPADGDFSAWEETDWEYQPCSTRTSAYPSFDRAGQVRHIVRTGPEYASSETLVVLRTTGDAEAFMGELRAAGAPCPTSDADGPTRASITPVDGNWGDGFVHALAYEYLDAPGSTAASAYLMAVRHGRAVVMTTVGGEFVAPVQGNQPAPAAVAELRATPDALASQLCLYTEAGC